MPPKRKAKDAASPKRPAASRALSTRASKGSLGIDKDDEESFDIVSRPAKKARGAAPRAAKRDDIDGDLEFTQPGRRASKPATVEQHLMDQNRKSKEFIQSFKEQVASGRDRLHETLTKLKQDLLNLQPSRNDDDLADIYTALQTAAAAAAATLSTKDNPLFAQTQQLLCLSRAILDCHHKVDAASRDPRLLALAASPREAWKRDEEGMRRLFECGRVYGERVVEGWISPEEREVDDEDEGDGELVDGVDGDFDEGQMREAERLARGLFERGKGEESWGVAARRQMVALTGVVRTLPVKKGGE